MQFENISLDQRNVLGFNFLLNLINENLDVIEELLLLF